MTFLLVILIMTALVRGSLEAFHDPGSFGAGLVWLQALLPRRGLDLSISPTLALRRVDLGPPGGCS